MARPQAPILLQQRIGQSSRQLTIAQARGYWIVVLDDQPINIISDSVWGFDTKKYVKNGWPNRHSAQTLCDKLNHWFNTDRFTVRQVV